MAIRVTGILEQLQTFPVSFHRQVAEFTSTVLKCPMTKENGTMTLGANTCLCIWYRIIPLIRSEEEARQYSQCLNDMYNIFCDNEDETIYSWWIHFWSIIGLKYPNVALNHVEQFLYDSIDRKQTMLTMLLPVNILNEFD